MESLEALDTERWWPLMVLGEGIVGTVGEGREGSPAKKYQQTYYFFLKVQAQESKSLISLNGVLLF